MMGKLLPGLRWATALATVVLAALLCWQCIDIYVTGSRPENLDANGVHITQVYTAEDVRARLAGLAAPAVVYAALIAVAVTAELRAPAEKERVALTAENRLRLMKKRVNALPDEALLEEHLRRRVWVGAGAVLAVCGAISLAYLLDGKHFVSWDLESVMGSMLLHIVPWVVLGLAAVYAAVRVCESSMLRECETLRGMLHDAVKPAAEKRAIPVGALRLGLYAAAIVFIVLGVMNGGLYDVLVKAIMICTECIGLG